jgi:hypothetical protein
MNVLQVIYPYKIGGIWAFDDAKVGLAREPFVGAANCFIDKVSEHIVGAEQGFRLIFSHAPFPAATLCLQRVRSEFGGTWYACEELGDLQGWLCSALNKYFDTVPWVLYAKGESLGDSHE